ncbi:hypothetical protein PAXRUDRAFT_823795 [Paxillus rubicundulus Ve08.2h10]|uniref:Uncharacterized protein n=1 Tax=Paxillus rubicundulus Ve08.2h10 TaxID=930991 RepID=A0A0D0E335_9AGAM|nr:hypothetical protein PAXRUDRAFT_823795 [Paxillus rubicundulus Ve08.2h10]
MFLCCDTQACDVANRDVPEVLELDESAATLRMLIELLHLPPPPPSLRLSAPQTRRTGQPTSPYCGSHVPYPLLPDMLRLVDKYDLSEPLRRSLHSHLRANACIHPMSVYAFATTHGLDDFAAEASAYLLHPPLSTYTKNQIATLPAATAYHALVRLHSYRVNRLKEILLSEDIFPFGYGACPTHQGDTTRIWNERRLLLATQIEAATDLAEEMRVLLQQFMSCKTCEKACRAAVAMLEVWLFS